MKRKPRLCFLFQMHPIKRFALDGASFSLNRDGPSITMASLDEEMEIVKAWGGITDAHITAAVSKADFMNA